MRLKNAFARTLTPLLMASALRCGPAVEPIQDSGHRPPRKEIPAQLFSPEDAGINYYDSGVSVFSCSNLPKMGFACETGQISADVPEGGVLPFGDFYLKAKMLSGGEPPTAFLEIQNQLCSRVNGQSYPEGNPAITNIMNGPSVSIVPRTINLSAEAYVQVAITREDCARTCIPGQTMSQTLYASSFMLMTTPMGDISFKLEDVRDSVAEISIQDNNGARLWNLSIFQGVESVADFWRTKFKLSAAGIDSEAKTANITVESETCALP